MVGIHGLTNSNYGKYAVGNNKKTDTTKKAEAAKNSTAAEVKSSEYKLSDKAQKYLDKLRKDYGDYDFVIACIYRSDCHACTELLPTATADCPAKCDILDMARNA